MSRAYLLVEGQTEETFVRELLQPHYDRMGLYLTPILVSTSRGHQGGVVSYAKVRPQIEHLCKQDADAYVSTMFDLYALPSDFPGEADPVRHRIVERLRFEPRRVRVEIHHRISERRARQFARREPRRFAE